MCGRCCRRVGSCSCEAWSAGTGFTIESAGLAVAGLAVAGLTVAGSAGSGWAEAGSAELSPADLGPAGFSPAELRPADFGAAGFGAAGFGAVGFGAVGFGASATGADGLRRACAGGSDLSNILSESGSGGRSTWGAACSVPSGRFARPICLRWGRGALPAAAGGGTTVPLILPDSRRVQFSSPIGLSPQWDLALRTLVVVGLGSQQKRQYFFKFHCGH